MTLEQYQEKVRKAGKLSGDLASLFLAAELAGWAATLVLQAKRLLHGIHDPAMAKAAVREILWHTAQTAQHMGISLAEAAAESLEMTRG
jgi:hypothetical protein